MTIETKFNINQYVWFIDSDTMLPNFQRIIQIIMKTDLFPGVEIIYKVERNNSQPQSIQEGRIFLTKEDLLKALSK
jgi:hypothetical protein